VNLGKSALNQTKQTKEETTVVLLSGIRKQSGWVQIRMSVYFRKVTNQCRTHAKSTDRNGRNKTNKMFSYLQAKLKECMYHASFNNYPSLSWIKYSITMKQIDIDGKYFKGVLSTSEILLTNQNYALLKYLLPTRIIDVNKNFCRSRWNDLINKIECLCICCCFFFVKVYWHQRAKTL
jgi:hypothetical protein